MLMDHRKVRDYIAWDEEPSTAGEHRVYLRSGRSILTTESLDSASPVRRGGRLREYVRSKRATAPKTVKNIAEFVNRLCAERDKPSVLVVGGGQIGLGTSDLYVSERVEVIAFDIYGSRNVHFIADGHDIPIADSSVDGVVIQAVLEHVLDPGRVVDEIARVLVPEGIVYAETPFMQHVHEGAYDFTRFSHSGHRWLFKKFGIIDSGALTGPATYFVWGASALATGIFRSRNAGRIAKIALHWVTYLDNLIPEPYMIDGACSVYFLGRLSTTTITPTDIVGHYCGAQG